MWFRKKKKAARRPPLRGGRRVRPVSVHYREHKELARALIHERLEYWNALYGFSYKRVFVKNQRRCWGSCSEKGNLNFNYTIVFLPEVLMDYVIVHELCHIQHLNHSKDFWNEVARAIPDHKEHRQHLRRITNIPKHGFPSSRAHAHVNQKIIKAKPL